MGLGYIYFIQKGKDGPIKIGRSMSPRSRLQQLQSSNDGRLSILGTMRETDTIKEGDVLGRFAYLKIRGEWFNPSRDLISFIKDNVAYYMPPPVCPASRLLELPYYTSPLDLFDWGQKTATFLISVTTDEYNELRSIYHNRHCEESYPEHETISKEVYDNECANSRIRVLTQEEHIGWILAINGMGNSSWDFLASWKS